MIVIGAIRLHMGVILVATQIDMSGERFIAPAFRHRIAIPGLSGIGVERNAVNSHPEDSREALTFLIDRFRFHRHLEGHILGFDAVGIAGIWESTGGMIRYAVGFDIAIGAAHRDLYFVGRKCGRSTISYLKLVFRLLCLTFIVMMVTMVGMSQGRLV